MTMALNIVISASQSHSLWTLRGLSLLSMTTGARLMLLCELGMRRNIYFLCKLICFQNRMDSVSLAEPRRRQKWTLNPRGNLWANDESKFGQKLMEKMGWEKGKGLGANENGRVEVTSLQCRCLSSHSSFSAHLSETEGQQQGYRV